MKPEFWRAGDAAAFLSSPSPESHKYSRGVLGLRTGSSRYPGATVLGAEAAWRTGIGLVRYVTAIDDSPPRFGLPSPAAAILARLPETVFSDGNEDPTGYDAWLVGSGTDPDTRSTTERTALLDLLAGSVPVVVDAGALGLVHNAHMNAQLAAPVIITPHLGEFRALWRLAELGRAPYHALPEPEEAAAILAKHFGITVLLKGSNSTIAAPSGAALSYGPATPWLATAGTGDVLAGILGALVATHAAQVSADTEILMRLGALAVKVHDTAARIASGDAAATGSGAPITGLDVAQSLPRAVHQLRG